MNIITNKDVFSSENESKIIKKVPRKPSGNRPAGGGGSRPQNSSRPVGANRPPRPTTRLNPNPKPDTSPEAENPTIESLLAKLASTPPEPELGSIVTPEQLKANLLAKAQFEKNQQKNRPTTDKTTFYQASRPKNVPEATGETIDPRSLIPNLMRDRGRTPLTTPSIQTRPGNNIKQNPARRVPINNNPINNQNSQQSNQAVNQASPLPVNPTHNPNQTQRPDQRTDQRPENPARPGGRFTTAQRRPGKGQMPQDGAGVFMQPNRQTPGQISPQPLRVNSAEKLKIIPLGGLEEIGKNMTVLEYGNDILIIDMGFMFPDSEMFGIDYVIPDVTYLEDKKEKIRGAIITHGHLDHIGAIPYLVEKLGFPTLYGTPITMGMARQRLVEFGLETKNKIATFETGKDVLKLGVFTVRSFHLTHSVPGAIGLEIETPNGRLVYCTDWKFDYSPADGEQVNFQELAAVGARGVDLLFSDSTNAERPGHSISEKVVESSLNSAIEGATGRVIIAMFSSNLSRIQQTLNAAAKNNRKVVIQGRSMQQNVEMAVNLKAMNVPANTLIGERELNRFNDNQILVLSTGAQGEDRSALSRMASGEHRLIKIKKGDTVIISASPIPGNERSVSGLMDVLYKAGASVIYNKILDVHSSGHAYQEDLKLMIALMRPKYFVPLHGERSKLIVHGKLAEEVGVKPENIILGDNGIILEMDSEGRTVPTDNHVPAGYVMVDGLGVGDVGNIVLRDRQAMAQEGVFLIFSVYDKKTNKFLNSPDIISRGFIYMRENEKFIADVRNEIKNFLQKSISNPKNVDMNLVRNELRDYISKMLYEKTERQPMVIPVITEV